MKWLGFVILLWFGYPLFAQSPAGETSHPAGSDKYAIADEVFVPPQYTVGDHVELRLSLLPKTGVQIIASRELPSQPWLKILGVNAHPEGALVRVTVKFIPFAPGSKTLPPLPLGDVVLSGIRIHTASVLNPQNPGDLAPPQPPLALPQTDLYLELGLFLVLVLPFVVWKLFRPISSLCGGLKTRTSRKKPFHRLEKGLKKLSLKAGQLPGPEFYTEFSLLVRRYLTDRLKKPMMAATPLDLSEMLRLLPSAWSAEWIRLVHRADVVRFDSRQPALAERYEDIAAVKAQVALLESGEGWNVDL